LLGDESRKRHPTECDPGARIAEAEEAELAGLGRRAVADPDHVERAFQILRPRILLPPEERAIHDQLACAQDRARVRIEIDLRAHPAEAGHSEEYLDHR
jgi:hypothetical protein